MGLINRTTVTGRTHVTLRVRLSVAEAMTLAEIAEAERRAPEDQAALMLEEKLRRLAEADPDERVSLGARA